MTMSEHSLQMDWLGTTSLSTSSREASRAKTSALLESVPGLVKALEADYGANALVLLASYDPPFAVFENVSNLLSGPTEQPGGWFATILRDLAELGYDAEWHDIPASYVGAWHRRGRVWLLAYPNQKRGQQGKSQGPIFRQRDLLQQLTRGFARWPGRSNLPQSRICGRHDGIPDVVDRIASLGNAVVPQIPELIGNAILRSLAA